MNPSEKTFQLLNHIGNELTLLWVQMDAYQELFLIEAEKRADLLQKTAPGFFMVTQVSMAESILMRLSRLMDRNKSCGQETSTLDHFKNTLLDDIRGQSSIKHQIENLRTEWCEGNGRFGNLKNARDKFLAHNDFTARSSIPADYLWMNLTSKEFSEARQLAGLLWDLYRQCNRVLRDSDVVEPIHSSLENRPSILLKRLCASQYFYSIIEDESEHIGNLLALEKAEMGDDLIRPVFSAQDSPLMNDTFAKGVQQ